MLRCLALLAVLATADWAVAAEPQRWALLVGVNDYVSFTDLRFSGRDAVALGEALRGAGFDERRVFLLHDDAKDAAYRPTKANIERQLAALLTLAGPDDLVIVAFSGHGIHFDGKSFLCPTEADDRKPAESMIVVADVYKQLDECKAAFKLLLVDACRNDPRPPGRKSASPDVDRRALGQTFARPPDGILVLQSCAEDQISWEDPQVGHGVFMHYVLKGLGGEADGNKNGRVTLGELYEYASDETKLFVANRFPGEIQIPSLNGKISGVFELPRTMLAQEFTNTVGQKFSLIAKGEFDMGSPDGDAATKQSEQPQHRVRITKPFYLGVHEVTQGQWRAVMGTSPWTGADNTREGADYPATSVTWDEAAEFCRKLSEKEGRQYRLPTEAEWEYACRAGSQTQFNFGNDATAIGEFAWFEDNLADKNQRAIAEAELALAESSYKRAEQLQKFGGISKDEFDNTTAAFRLAEAKVAAVGQQFAHAVGQKRPNAWGLFDMHGNVWEWCSDGFDKYVAGPADDPQYPAVEDSRVLRGGGWFNSAAECRSAARGGPPRSHRDYTIGFRVALTP